MKRALLPAMLAALLAGCAAAPVAIRPPLPEPAHWQMPSAAGADALGPEFWTRFGSPTLIDLMRQADAANPDLQIAAQRLRIAGDGEKIAEAQRLPSLSFEAGSVDSSVVTVRDRGHPRIEVFRLGFSASYELDFWDRLASRSAASKAESLAQAYDLQTARERLAGELASRYFDLAEADESSALLQQRLALAEERVSLESLRLGAGRSDGEALLEAQRAVDEIRAAQRGWQQQRQQAVWQIAVLCGQLPEGFVLPIATLRQNLQSPEIPAGLPSSLLQRRSDLQAAQARLQAADAEAAAAWAEQFPQIRLTAELGVASDLLQHALSKPVGLFGIGPEISLPLYDGGQRAAQLDARRGEAELAAAEYRKAGLTAFAEVEAALLRVQRSRELQQQTGIALARQQEQRQRLDHLLQAGRRSRLEVIAAQDQQLALEQQALAQYRAGLDAVLALHAALGGSWPQQELAAAMPQPLSTGSPP